MIMNYQPGRYETLTEYKIAFDDGLGNGFQFDCDDEGHLPKNMKEEFPAAYKNYKECLAHPEKFKRFNKIVKNSREVYECPEGICSCGERVYLHNQFHGACQCPSCGKWYNLFGQELIPPEEWEGEF